MILLNIFCKCLFFAELIINKNVMIFLLMIFSAYFNIYSQEKIKGVRYLSSFSVKDDSNSILESSYEIAIGPTENKIFVTDSKNNRIIILDKNYNYIDSFRHSFDFPYAIAIRDDNLYVGNTYKYFIDVFNKDGSFLRTLNTGSLKSHIAYISSMAFTSDGSLFVVNSVRSFIDIFDKGGNYLFSFGGDGVAKGQFTEPYGVAVSSNDSIYITDNNNRIQVFDKNGLFLFQWGRSGSRYGEFDTPRGIAIDKFDNIYVADSINSRIQVFDKGGKYVYSFGKRGTRNGEFGRPYFITLDSNDRIYVVDEWNYRTQVFALIY